MVALYSLTFISNLTVVEHTSITHLVPGKSGLFFTRENEEIPKVKFLLD